jgi:polysaccharide pyruvyl transferase WcaK-like protein
MAISTRYHGILLPGLLGKPVVAVSYGPKSDELMERIGQGQFVLDINTLTVDSLIDKFLLLEAESDTMRTIRIKEIQQSISGLQQRLDAEYDRVFEALGDQITTAAYQVLKPF